MINLPEKKCPRCGRVFRGLDCLGYCPCAAPAPSPGGSGEPKASTCPKCGEPFAWHQLDGETVVCPRMRPPGGGAETGPVTLTCRCGARRLLSATGVRYEDNAGAICRHTTSACTWHTASSQIVTETERLSAEAHLARAEADRLRAEAVERGDALASAVREARQDREYARIKAAEAASARARAEQYERDWYAANSEFGDAMAKAAEKTRAAESARDLALEALRGVEWSGGNVSTTAGVFRICPACRNTSNMGHAEKCAVARALAGEGTP